MKNKYQYKTKDSIRAFDTKNEFIEFCQSRYNDSFNSRHNYNFYFSYDYGQTWHPIKDFKSLRPTIQNEKKSDFFSSNPSSNTAKSVNWLGTVVIFFSIWTVLTILNDRVKKISFINNFNGFVFGWDSRFVRNDGSREKMENNASEEDVLIEASDQDNEFLRNVQVTDYAREIYANSFLNEMNVTAEEKKWILGILSDPNPDPRGEAGNICYRQSLRCVFCSNFIPSRLYTLKDKLMEKVGPYSAKNMAIKFYINRYRKEGDNTRIQSEQKETEAVEIDEPNDVKRALNNIDWEGALNDATTNIANEGFDEIKSIIFMYKNNVRVECLHTPIDEKFCSETCSIEYKYSR